MAAESYGPEDTWPDHQMPFWNKALKVARAAGWQLAYIGAPHKYGTVRCPADVHHIGVDKTARGAETKAKELEKDVRSCMHGPAAAKCLQALDRAIELTDLAQRGLTLAETKHDAEERMDLLAAQVAAQLEAADVTLAKVLLEAQDAAIDAAIVANDAPTDDELATMIDDASEEVAGAASAARDLPLTSARAALVRRVRAAQNEVRALQERLNSLKQRAGMADQ